MKYLRKYSLIGAILDAYMVKLRDALFLCAVTSVFRSRRWLLPSLRCIKLLLMHCPPLHWIHYLEERYWICNVVKFEVKEI